MPNTHIDLEAHLAAVRTSLATITGSPQVVIRATLPADAAYPQSASHLILDVIPTTPTATLDGSIYEDLALQVGAWASDSLVTALALAEAARVKMVALDYRRTGGANLVTEEQYHGVLATYTLTAAFDTFT